MLALRVLIEFDQLAKTFKHLPVFFDVEPLNKAFCDSMVKLPKNWKFLHVGTGNNWTTTTTTLLKVTVKICEREAERREARETIGKKIN